MIIHIFAASVLAKPLNNAQIVRGVFCLYTFEYGESYCCSFRQMGQFDGLDSWDW